jgi:hypothetical protein
MSRKENGVRSKIGSEAGSLSYRGMSETIGTQFPLLSVPGSRKGGAHYRSVEVGGVIHRGV